MLKTYGHRNVYILNGGLRKWIADGYLTTTEETSSVNQEADASATNADYDYTFDPILYRDFN